MFYEIESKITMRPASPVTDAMIEFYQKQKLRQMQEETIMSDQPFECCEICWLNIIVVNVHIVIINFVQCVIQNGMDVLKIGKINKK